MCSAEAFSDLLRNPKCLATAFGVRVSEVATDGRVVCRPDHPALLAWLSRVSPTTSLTDAITVTRNALVANSALCSSSCPSCHAPYFDTSVAV